jgi:hypothetical protein
MFGPILDSKFNRVTVAGNSNPTHMNKIAACASALVMSTRNGAKHQNNSVDVGTLTAAPSHGGIHLNATWVRTNAAPKPNVELSASRIAIGVSPWVGVLGSRSIHREAHLKTCPECNGDGVIEKGTDDEQQCPTCGGSGFVPDNDDDEEVIRTTSR